MADISDVEQALADLVTNVVYPAGPDHSSIFGVTCRIYRGWPNASALSLDLTAGVVNVTISPDNEFGKTTTRYLSEWQFNSVTPSLTATVAGQTVLIAGVASVGNVVGVLVDGDACAYRVVAGDTPELVAAIICTMIQPSLAASVSGSTVHVPGATKIIARVVCDNTAYFEGRRQEKGVQIILWCPNPTIRDLLASAIDVAISGASFLPLVDNTSAHVNYRNSATFDQSQNALLYRRDLLYCVEYPTVLCVDLPSMLFGGAAINGQTNFG